MVKNKIISIAPMMDWTDRHCRYFHRLIAPSVRLYTEMVTTGALVFGNDRQRFLGFNQAEHPVALQLGGSDPADLATCAKIGEEAGYDEINLNCGCPSDRVQSGAFGACLMNNPALVADCVKAMSDAVSIPVTVKCRIGIDDSEDYTFLENFINVVSKDGDCQTFIIHARKAWLKGLSPKENREIPPLQYDIVERIKAAFPDLTIHVNGGIKTIEQIHSMLGSGERSPLYPPACGGKETAQTFQGGRKASDTKKEYSRFKFNGVMIGREAYQNPWFLRQVEEEFFDTTNLPTAEQIVEQMIPYIKDQQQHFDTPVKSITRHMSGLFQGLPGARVWRQVLSTEVHQDGVTAEILKTALDKAFSA